VSYKDENNMKTMLVLVIVGVGLSAKAGVLAGPVVNPANGHNYYLLSQNTWSNAEAEAISLGGHLATIRNADENQWVFSTFGSYGGALWIGLTDRDKVFTFKWVSGEPLSYTNFSGDQPDNGTGGIEYYVHIWNAAIKPCSDNSKWNDYGNGDTVLGVPLYGVAEVSPASTVRLSLHAPSDTAKAQAVANLPAAATTVPELRAFTAIELSWPSETNKLYRIQWTPSLNQPQWLNLEPTVSGTGTNVSVFDSTREHPQGFYRVQAVQ
jgi:hypothetical protein